MAAKKKQVSSQEAKDMILNYLEQQYRPYSANDIIQNLHGAIPKAIATRALEDLAAEDKIITKQFGKISISVAKKVEMISQEETLDYDSQLEILNNEIALLIEKSTDTQKEIANVTQSPTDEELKADYERLFEENKRLQDSIKKQESETSISSQSVEAIKALAAIVNTKSQKRAKWFKDVMRYISEYIDPKKLSDDLGLEDPQVFPITI